MAKTEKVTLTLPRNLMSQVREMAPARGHSKFVAEALEYFIKQKKRYALRERLIAGYQANAEMDAALTAEWEATDDEAWEKHIEPYDDGEPGDEWRH